MTDLDELRRLAEDAALWRDEWDGRGDDNSAIGRYLDALDPLTVLGLIGETERLRRMVAMLPGELTRLADLLEAKRPLPSNRADYFEGWLDAIHAVQDELRSLRSDIDGAA